MMNKLICLAALIPVSVLATSIGFAKSITPVIALGQSYTETKAELLQQNWTPVKNSRISSSSLVAQDIYKLGNTEVVDCISMELDACWFRFQKNGRVLEIKTIMQPMKVDSYKILKP